MGQALDGALAATPFVLLVVLMAGCRWPAARAAGAGLAVSLALAWAWFDGFGAGDKRWESLAGALAEALFGAVTIAAIVLAALCIHHLQDQGPALGRLRTAVAEISPDPRIKAILVGWFFALFLEGAAGFGTPVALAAPLLVAFGFRAVDAVALALLGHAIGVSFGAVGTPVLTQATLTGIEATDIARVTGLLHGALGMLMLSFFALLTMKVAPPPEAPADASGHIWGWFLFAGVAFLVPYGMFAYWLGPELPTMGAALVGAAVFIAALMASRRRSPNLAPASETMRADGTMPIALAAAPYLVLAAAVAITRSITPLKSLLQSYTWEWSLFDEFGGTIQPLYHPSSLLFFAFLAGGLIQRTPWRSFAAAARGAATQVAPAALALVLTLGMSRIMVHGGITAALAISASALVGGLWPLMAPYIGALGTFTTGSATASNILLTDFQEETALRLGVSTVDIVGVQCFGAAVGNVVAPHNIIAGGATVSLSGREGEVLRKTAVPGLCYTGAGAIVALLRARVL